MLIIALSFHAHLLTVISSPTLPSLCFCDNATDPSSADASTSTFVSSMVFNTVIATVLMLSFGIARAVSKRVYAPRTYLVPERYTYKPYTQRTLPLESMI